MSSKPERTALELIVNARWDGGYKATAKRMRRIAREALDGVPERTEAGVWVGYGAMDRHTLHVSPMDEWETIPEGQDAVRVEIRLAPGETETEGKTDDVG